MKYEISAVEVSLGLEALSYLDDIAHGRKMNLDPHELKIIIENILKDYEDVKRTSYNRLLKIGELVGQINENEKKLKALEIIKKDANLVIAVMSNCKGGEYDLLKEVLL